MNLKNYFSNDFLSGVVVFLVALPLCLGIALASGAPSLFSGIISGIIGGVIVGALSKSPLSVSGPAAGLTTIVLAAIGELGFPSFLLSVVLAGLFQIILGFIRAGSIGNFFPASVIKGMLAAIGLILILKQLPHAVGYDSDFEGDESFTQPDSQNTFSEIVESINYWTVGAVLVSILSIAILILWNTNMLQRYKFFRLAPGALFVVLLGVLISFTVELFFPSMAIEDKHKVIVPALSSGATFSSFITFPDFTIFNSKVIFTALTLAVVASLETLLSIEACDKLDPYRRITPLNRELKAQGLGNVLCGLLGGLPVTSVIVRSSANINSGAKTKASSITHGIILLLAVILIPSLLKLIPLACLAGILIVIGFKLTPPSLYKEMYQKGISQFLPFIVTVLAVVFTNLLQGVFMGILVAVFFILKTNFREAIIVVNEKSNYLLKFTKDVSFLNKATLREIFHKIPSNSTMLIDGSQANFIDNDIRELIVDFIETSKVKNIQIELKNI